VRGRGAGWGRESEGEQEREKERERRDWDKLNSKAKSSLELKEHFSYAILEIYPERKKKILQDIQYQSNMISDSPQVTHTLGKIDMKTKAIQNK
jgi:hypothetical protein